MEERNSKKFRHRGVIHQWRWMIAWFTDKLAAFELDQVLRSKSHPGVFTRHRAGFINNRVHVLAILFSVFVAIWACINFAFFVFPLAASLFVGLLLAALAFVSLAIVCRWDPTIAHARIGIAFLLGISAAVFIFSNELLSGAVLTTSGRIAAASYALLPLVLLISLGLFPLVAFELILFTFPVVSVFVVAYLTNVSMALPTFVVLAILFVLILCGIVAGANSISQLQLMRQMFQESLRDPLTRAINRHSGETILQLHIAQIRRKPAPLCVAFLDLDNFKEINDRFGHDAGDGVLRCMADLLRTSLREGDTLIRWAGDEFLIIMPHAKSGDASLRLEMLIERAKFPRIGNTTLTWSGGIAEWPSEAKNFGWQDLVALADSRMYRAKGAGRNRVLTS